MPNDTTASLREMAANRGLKLVASRRRKPGGDYGRYGLHDADGAAVFGVGKAGLTASAAEIEDYLRGATSNAWSKSAGSAKALPKAKAKPAPKPKPKPRFKPQVANLLNKLPAAKRAEAFTEILERPGIRIERIVSRGQATPADTPMLQNWDEWVVVLEGAAGLRIEDSAEVVLAPGDHLLIAKGQRHWVTWTAKDRATVWLAVHLG
ncbi:cupin domain-containing protein [Sphingomonas sp. KR3-1]|uniref:cupin domain-containing protein n=1 Tax=Sphingomonas sp. KR3-1 TaxID=3156611 RepID=UPI0032B470E5